MKERVPEGAVFAKARRVPEYLVTASNNTGQAAYSYQVMELQSGSEQNMSRYNHQIDLIVCVIHSYAQAIIPQDANEVSDTYHSIPTRQPVNPFLS